MLECAWRLLPFCDDYAVHESGVIKRVKSDIGLRYLGRVLKPALMTGGYPGVTIAKDRRHHSKKVATLVCEAFHGPKPSEGHQVAHNDGNKLNSAASNLRWATAKENAEDKRIHGTLPTGDRHPSRVKRHMLRRGESHPNASLTWHQVWQIRLLPITQKAAARLFGVSQSTISDIRRGKIWKEAA